MTISYEIYNAWKDQPILHDEDMWDGKYKTYGEMWIGENYTIEGKSKMTNVFIIEKSTIPAWGYEIVCSNWFHNIAPSVEAAVSYLKGRYGYDVRYIVRNEK